MGLTFYEIDPSGDTLLILHNANAPFAVIPPSASQEEQKASEPTPDDKPTSEPRDADSRPREEDSKPQEEDSKSIVQMRLSSKHLALASRYFQKLTTNGKETKETTPEYGYSYVVNANDWDEKALLALMNIIHGRTTKVPQYITLEMLAKIAVLVDYYQCHEAVAFFAQTWLNSISILIPKEGERDFMLRLVVCLVFSEEDMNFRILTKRMIWGSTGPIDSLGLPIQQDIIDALNKSREDSILAVVSGLHALKKRLCEDQSCSYECSSIYLGALTKAMSNMRIMDPLPSRPFPGHSLLTLEQAIRDIKEPVWQTNCPRSSVSPAAPTSTKPSPFPSGGLFGSNSSAKPAPSPSGGLFGNPAANSSTKPAPSPSGGAFGTNSSATTAPAPSGGLFGNSSAKTASPSGGLFGTNSSATATPAPSGGLFGAKPTYAPGGLFGNHLAANPSATTASPSGGLFGNPPANSSTNASTPRPICNLAEKTKPIIEELLGKVKSLDLDDFVKQE